MDLQSRCFWTKMAIISPHFVELPNVSAFGQTPDKALVELKAAWELMKACYREDGVSIPKANRDESVSRFM